MSEEPIFSILTGKGSITVSGAGSSEFNGVYNESGTINGQPYYVKQEGSTIYNIIYLEQLSAYNGCQYEPLWTLRACASCEPLDAIEQENYPRSPLPCIVGGNTPGVNIITTQSAYLFRSTSVVGTWDLTGGEASSPPPTVS